MARKTTEIVSLSLRIREELRKRLEREAKRADRSMNAEIVQRLEQSFQQEDIIKTIERTMAGFFKDLQLVVGRKDAQVAGFIAGIRDEKLAAGSKDDAVFKRALRDVAYFDPDEPEGEDKS